MLPHAPTPEWAVSCMDRILKYDDADLLDAVLELLATVASDKDADKFKYEAAWAAIDYGFTKTEGLRPAARRYLGVAV